MKYSPSLDICLETLVDFGEEQQNLQTVTLPDGESVFAPYLLTSEQVGSVGMLLYLARKLEQEIAALKNENQRLRDMLSNNQGFLDQSIAYLDPEDG